MKHSIVLILVFLSCSISYPTGTKEYVFKWIDDNYNYTADDKEHWQTPDETLKKMTGDCEDWAILALYMLDQINIKARFAGVRKIEYEHGYFHACIEIDGRIYEPRGGSDVTDDYEISFLLTYDEVMFFRIFNI